VRDKCGKWHETASGASPIAANIVEVVPTQVCVTRDLHAREALHPTPVQNPAGVGRPNPVPDTTATDRWHERRARAGPRGGAEAAADVPPAGGRRGSVYV